MTKKTATPIHGVTARRMKIDFTTDPYKHHDTKNRKVEVGAVAFYYLEGGEAECSAMLSSLLFNGAEVYELLNTHGCNEMLSEIEEQIYNQSKLWPMGMNTTDATDEMIVFPNLKRAISLPMRNGLLLEVDYSIFVVPDPCTIPPHKVIVNHVSIDGKIHGYPLDVDGYDSCLWDDVDSLLQCGIESEIKNLMKLTQNFK